MCDLGRLELTGQLGILYRQVYRKVSKQASCKQASKQTSLQVVGMEVSFGYICSAGHLLVAVKSIFVNQLINAKNLKLSKTQFQIQFKLSLAQLSPSLYHDYYYINKI